MRVLTIGTFDLLHEGHIDLFKRCQQLAQSPRIDDGSFLNQLVLTTYGELRPNEVVIGVNSDEFVKDYKGALPWVPQHSRLAQVQAYGTPRVHEGRPTWEFIERIAPNYIVIGSDWARKDYVGQLGVTWDWLDERNIGILYVPLVPGISSTIVKTHRD